MERVERDFKGIWIPKEIWLSKDLTLQEKLFFVEIDSLDNKEGCYASNQYFATFFGISKTRVSIVINSLIKKGYIKSSILYKEGTKQILKRVLNKSYRPYTTKVKDPIQQKFKDSNTSNNTENNITPNPLKGNTQSLNSERSQIIVDKWNKTFDTKLELNRSLQRVITDRLKDYNTSQLVEIIDKYKEIKDLIHNKVHYTGYQLYTMFDLMQSRSKVDKIYNDDIKILKTKITGKTAIDNDDISFIYDD